jgi:hypothetical protein
VQTVSRDKPVLSNNRQDQITTLHGGLYPVHVIYSGANRFDIPKNRLVTKAENKVIRDAPSSVGSIVASIANEDSEQLDLRSSILQ